MSFAGYIYGEPWRHRHERRERAAMEASGGLRLFVERCGGAWNPLKDRVAMDFGERGCAYWRPKNARFVWLRGHQRETAHLHTVDEVRAEIHRRLEGQREAA